MRYTPYDIYASQVFVNTNTDRIVVTKRVVPMYSHYSSKIRIELAFELTSVKVNLITILRCVLFLNI